MSAELWSAKDAAIATGGEAIGEWVARGVSIDTRSLVPGDLFVALTDIRDGHDFVAQALEKGAAAALVSRIPDNLPNDAPLLIVDDVLGGLEKLGLAGRARTKAKVIGVTGSVGKTSTKEMLRVILERQGQVHAAERSFNNHWGVPLTLARMPVEADYAVIEIGMNHPGEIAPLAKMARPHVALITTVAAAHLEAFEDINGIAEEKAAIFEGLEPDGVAIINNDIETRGILLERAKAVGAPQMTFGSHEGATARISDVRISTDATVVAGTIDSEPFLFKLSVPGRHFAANGLGALVTAEAVGADRDLAATDLALWQPPAGRGTRETLRLDPIENSELYLIDDAFNANPTSMAAALEVLAASAPKDGTGHLKRGRRIAVLGDMLELGPDEKELHQEIAALESIDALDVVHCVGPRMKAFFKRLPKPKRGEYAKKASDLAEHARQLVDAGDVILIKGSKGSKVSLVVDALRKLSHPAPGETQG